MNSGRKNLIMKAEHKVFEEIYENIGDGKLRIKIIFSLCGETYEYKVDVNAEEYFMFKLGLMKSYASVNAEFDCYMEDDNDT